MRSIKGLLELMLKHPEHFRDGLCGWSAELYWKGVIVDTDEVIAIRRYVVTNRPSKWSSFKAFKQKDSPYFWPQGDIKPRIKWLNKHIKLNS